MGKLVYLDQPTRLDVPAERVLKRARKAGLKTVVVMGWKEDGKFYAISSAADGGTVLWLTELLKQKLFEAAEKLT